MRSILVSVLVVTLVAAVGAGVIAAPPGDDPQGTEPVATEVSAQPARDPAPDLRRQLNLTEEQARRITQVMAASQERTARLRIALGRARLDARELMLEATPDRGRLDAVARRIGELQGQLVRARFDVQLELRQVLTPEQQARLRLLMARRAALRRSRLR